MSAYSFGRSSGQIAQYGNNQIKFRAYPETGTETVIGTFMAEKGEFMFCIIGFDFLFTHEPA